MDLWVVVNHHSLHLYYTVIFPSRLLGEISDFSNGKSHWPWLRCQSKGFAEFQILLCPSAHSKRSATNSMYCVIRSCHNASGQRWADLALNPCLNMLVIRKKIEKKNTWSSQHFWPPFCTEPVVAQSDSSLFIPMRSHGNAPQMKSLSTSTAPRMMSWWKTWHPCFNMVQSLSASGNQQWNIPELNDILSPGHGKIWEDEDDS